MEGDGHAVTFYPEFSTCTKKRADWARFYLNLIISQMRLRGRVRSLRSALASILADALACHVEIAADFLERVGPCRRSARAQARAPGVALGERRQGVLHLFAQHFARGGVHRLERVRRSWMKSPNWLGKSSSPTDAFQREPVPRPTRRMRFSTLEVASPAALHGRVELGAFGARAQHGLHAAGAR